MRKRLKRVLYLGAVFLLLATGLPLADLGAQTMGDPNLPADFDLGVQIEGVTLTPSNYQEELAKYPGVSFDLAAQKLTLSGIRLRLEKGLVVRKPLTIELNGEEYLESKSGWSQSGVGVLQVLAKVSLKGPGSLHIHSAIEGVSPVLLGAAGHLRVDDGATLYAFGSNYPSTASGGNQAIFAPSGAKNATLEVGDGAVYAYAKGGSVWGVKLAMHDGVGIRHPEGASYDEAQAAVVRGGEVVRGAVLIQKDPAKEYGFIVRGERINSATTAFPLYHQLWGNSFAKHVEFDPDKEELIFNELEVEDDFGGILLETDGEPRRIRLIGRSELELKGGGASVAKFRGSVVFCGHGSLYLSTPGKPTVLVEGEHELSVEEGARLSIGGAFGIQGEVKDGEDPDALVSILVKDGSLRINASKAAITFAKEVTLSEGNVYESHGTPYRIEESVTIDGEAHRNVLVKSDGNAVRELATKPAESYDISIGGVPLTSTNYMALEDLAMRRKLFPVIKNGVVSYDPATETLTLEDASFALDHDVHGANSVIKSSRGNLSISLKGVTLIQSNSWVEALDINSVVMQGEGILRVLSERTVSILNFTLDGCFVQVWPNLYSQGNDAFKPLNTKNLTVRGRARLWLKPRSGRWEEASPIYGEVNATLTGSKVHVPAGAKFEGNKLVDKDGKKVRTSLYIGPADELPMPTGLSLAGVEVTSFNAYRLEELENGQPVLPGLTLGKGGHAIYEPVEQTFFARDIKLVSKADGVPGIAYQGSEDLAIALEGSNQVVSAGGVGLLVKGNVFLEVGQLDIQANKAGVVIDDGKKLAVGSNVRLEVLAGEEGVLGPKDDGQCSLDSQSLLHIVSGKEPMKGIATLQPDGVEVLRPSGASYSQELKGIVGSDGALLTSGDVLIRTANGGGFGIFIGEIELNPTNCGDITPANFPGMRKGSATYDAASNRLEISDFEGILRIESQGVNVVAKGMNRLYEASQIRGSVILTGGGTLRYEDATMPGKVTLREDTWLHLKHREGIDGLGTGSLRIEDGNLVATQDFFVITPQVVLRNMHSIELAEGGRAVRYPAEATIKEGQILMEDGVTEVQRCVVIAKAAEPAEMYEVEVMGVALDEAMMEAYRVADIYFLKGRFAYNHTEKTLSLLQKDFVVGAAKGIPAVRSAQKGLRIALDLDGYSLKGAKNTDVPIIELLADAEISGKGKIEGKVTEAINLKSPDVVLTVAKGANVEFISDVTPVVAASSGKLVLNGSASFESKDPSQSLFQNISSIALGEGIGVLVPHGGQVVGGAVQLEGVEAKGRVIFGDNSGPLGVTIGDVAITMDNYQQLGNVDVFPAIKSGEVAYDPATKTLTLTKAKIEGGIKSGIAGVIIEVKEGRSEMMRDGIEVAGELSVRGEGELVLNGEFVNISLEDNSTLRVGDKVSLAVGGSITAQYEAKNTQLEIKEEAQLLVGQAVKTHAFSITGGQAIQYPPSCEFDDDAANMGASPGLKVKKGGVFGDLAKHVIIRKDPIDSYDFFLGGIELNDFNSQFLVPGVFPVIQSGEVSILEKDGNPEGLLLSDAKLSHWSVGTPMKAGASSKLSRVLVKGRSSLGSLRVLEEAFVSQNASFTFTSEEEAMLVITGEDPYADNAKPAISIPANTELEFTGKLTIEVSGDVAIKGEDHTTSKLKLDGVTLSARSLSKSDTNYGAIRSVSLSYAGNTSMVKPVGGAISAMGDVVDTEGDVVEYALFSPSPIENYNFSIGGIDVTSHNAKVLGSLPAVSLGTNAAMSFDPNTKTLSVSGSYVRVESTNHPALHVKPGAELTVKMEEHTSLNLRSNVHSVLNSGTLTVDGGKLSAESRDGILINNAGSLKLTGGVQASITGTLYGIRGEDNESLEVIDASLTVEGQTISSITRLKAFTYPSTMVLKPVEAAFNEAKKAVCIGDEEVVGQVTLEFVPYHFSVGGVAVTSQNVGSLSDQAVFPAVKAGQLSYDPTTKVLTLNGVTVKEPTTDAIAITDAKGPETIEFKGENSLTGLRNGIESASRLTLRGEGSLTASGEQGSGLLARGANAGLVLESGDITLSGRYGLDANGSVPVALKRNVVLKLKGSKGAMLGVKKLDRDQIFVSQPKGARYDATVGAIVLGGVSVADQEVLMRHMSLKVAPETLTLNDGASEPTELTVSVEPAEMSQEYTLVAHGDVVEIDGHKITPKTIGTGVITVMADASAELTKEVAVEVRAYVPLNSITLSETTLELKYNSTKQLTVTFDPAEPSDKTLQWESDDESVATVSSEGLVTAKGAGEASITVNAADGKSAQCTVTVVVVPLQSIALSKTALTLNQGFDETLTVTYTPNEGVMTDVEWSSSAPAVASVDNGLVKALAPGKAVITVKSKVDPSKTATCQVTVNGYHKLEGISFNPNAVEITVTAKTTLRIVFEPANATNKKLTWSSSDEGIVTVTQGGLLEGIAEGTARITATSEEGGHTAECEVTVKAAVRVTGVTLDSTQLTVMVNATKMLTAVVAPADASNKAVEWSSDNPAVATVAGGAVTGVAVGTANITVKTKDGGFTASCSVTVKAAEDKPSSAESTMLAGVQVAPNPFGAHLLLRNASAIQSYELVSVSGGVVASGASDGADELSLNTEHLPAGLYLLRLQAADGARTIRVMKR